MRGVGKGERVERDGPAQVLRRRGEAESSWPEGKQEKPIKCNVAIVRNTEGERESGNKGGSHWLRSKCPPRSDAEWPVEEIAHDRVKRPDRSRRVGDGTA